MNCSIKNEKKEKLKELNTAYTNAVTKEKELLGKCLHEQMEATDVAFAEKFPELKEKNITLMEVYSENAGLTEDEAKSVSDWLDSKDINEVRQKVLDNYKTELEDLKIKRVNAEDKLLNYMSNNTNELLTKLMLEFSEDEEKDFSTLYRKQLLARTISTYLTATI